MPLKWLDNLLSQHELPGVSRSRRGVQRRISDQGVLAIELTRLLAQELGVGIRQAAALASQAVRERSSDVARIATGSGLTIVIPVGVVEARMRERIVAALESVGPVRRGWPPAGVRHEKSPDA